MRVLNIAESLFVQFSGGGEENVNPGSDGTTTWYETFLPAEFAVLRSVRGLMTGENSWKDPGCGYISRQKNEQFERENAAYRPSHEVRPKGLHWDPATARARSGSSGLQ
jgi:hypothetical protein